MLASAAVSVAFPPSAARAQSGCPGAAVTAASVDLLDPRPGDQVKGVVTVHGRVSAPLAVSRVQLQVGRTIVDSRGFQNVADTEFGLSWDATHFPPGRVTLRVVACGQATGGVLVEGSSTVAVEVVAAEASRRSGPIWVGAVVGLSGLAGLAVSRALTVRRHRIRDP
jgi:hypothetical protein